MQYKIILFTATTLALLLTYAFDQPTNDGERLAWSADRKLGWDDFQGEPDSLQAHLQKAETKTTIEVLTKIYATTIEYKVVCYFEKSESWATVDTSSALLAHEQLHFDISELYARKLRAQLPDISYLNSEDLEAKVRALYRKILLETVEFQHQYDLETAHSKNRVQQKKWAQKITAMLEDTKAYQSSTVIAKK